MFVADNLTYSGRLQMWYQCFRYNWRNTAAEAYRMAKVQMKYYVEDAT